MMLSLVLLISILQTAFINADESHVTVLTDANFQDTISAHKFILVKFYAPWCGHCKALAPEYEKAALQLHEKGSEIKLAKLDATVEKNIASQHEIRGYPTLKFFIDQVPIEYTGGRDAASIVNWVLKKTGPPAVPLESLAKAREIIDGEEFVVVGFFKDPNSPAVESFKKVANSVENVAFAIATAPEILNEYKVTKDAQVSIFRKFDDPRVDYPSDNMDNLANFIREEQVHLVTDFTPESASIVFSSPIKRHVVAFVSKSSADVRPQLLQSAKDLKGIAHILIVDTEVEHNGRIMEFFNIKKEELPTYRVIDLHQEMIKYKPESSEIKSELVTSFVEKCAKGQWDPYYASEEIPAEDTKPVRVLVGKNYLDVVKDKSKNVFVKLYAPWCDHCRKLAPDWEELARKFADHDDIIIAKMDVTANEVPGLRVESYPTLKFYPKDSDEVIDYNGDRSVSALAKFVESNGKVITSRGKKTDEDEDEEDEEPRDEL